MDKKIVQKSFIKSLPVLCSYIFLGTAYGILMEETGFPWYYSALASATIYTGAFQFVLNSFLCSAASIVTVIVACLLISSRQTFYSLTFLNEFKELKGARKIFMIDSLTDETYAIDCSMTETGQERKDIMLFLHIFCKCYWFIGSIIGGVLGQLLPYDMTGIDFCMTALFIILFMNQLEQAKKKYPILIGLASSIGCLIIFGKSTFILPALLIISALMVVMQKFDTPSKEEEVAA